MKIVRFKKFLYTPYFLAGIISLIIIIFLPDLFLKYTVELVKRSKTQNKDEINYYYDLDGDGNSDKIISFLTTQGCHSIQTFNHQDGIIDQWNLNGIIASGNERLIVGDFNGDYLNEIFTFSQSNDSIFLYAFIPIEKGSFFIRHKFITTINEVNGRVEYTLHDLSLTDMNNDGFKDLVFIISAGFSLQPRKIYIYDIINKILLSSPESGTIIGNITFFDINNDGYDEIIGDLGAAGNVNDSLLIPYSDYSAWFMVFDHNLNFLFHPIEFPGFKSFIGVQPNFNKSRNSVLVLSNSEGSKGHTPILYRIDENGKIIKKKELPFSTKISRYLFKSEDPPFQYFIIEQSGIIQRINPDLEMKIVAKLKTNICSNPQGIFDIDEDVEMEYVFKESREDNYIITRNDFCHPVKIELPKPTEKNSRSNISLIKRNNHSQLFIQRGSDLFFYGYGFNNLYLLRIPIYLGIYLLTLLLIFLIRKLQQIQIRDKIILQTQISELQLKTISNQLDPHFTLNAFNSIASLLKKEKGDLAYNYFIKFSNLVRSNLISVDKISRSLKDELSIVENYLDIQKLRFDNKFNYEILINKNVDISWRIPKMTIQNYIENSVKHGLKNKKTGGLLKIEIIRNNNHIILHVSDNGIGRKKAGELESESTGMGLDIINHYFNLLNKYNSVKIKQEIVDLYDDQGNPAGTEVMVELPININYNIYKYV